MKRTVVMTMTGEDDSDECAVRWAYPKLECTSDVNLERNGAMRLARHIQSLLAGGHSHESSAVERHPRDVRGYP